MLAGESAFTFGQREGEDEQITLWKLQVRVYDYGKKRKEKVLQTQHNGLRYKSRQYIK
jgi:hypothetical protein